MRQRIIQRPGRFRSPIDGIDITSGVAEDLQDLVPKPNGLDPRVPRRLDCLPRQTVLA
jgi:hypothetical protein